MFCLESFSNVHRGSTLIVEWVNDNVCVCFRGAANIWSGIVSGCGAEQVPRWCGDTSGGTRVYRSNPGVGSVNNSVNLYRSLVNDNLDEINYCLTCLLWNTIFEWHLGTKHYLLYLLIIWCINLRNDIASDQKIVLVCILLIPIVEVFKKSKISNS